MEKGSLAAMELMVFLGLVAWLLYYQFSTSRRDSERRESGSGDTAKEEKGEASPPGS